MKNIFRYLSLLLLVSLLSIALFSCAKNTDSGFSIPERAIEDDTVYKYGDYSYYIYNDNTAIISEYSGTDASVTIPDDIEGNKVVAIAPGAFAFNTSLTSLSISNTVEIIGEMAFDGCTSLSSVKIGKNVWSIGPDAFNESPWHSSLTDEFVILGDSVLYKYNGNAACVTIPESVKHIGPAFYENERICDVEIGDGVYTIGSGAFLFSSVSRVSLGNNIILIDNYAFQGCEKLVYVNIPDSVKTISHFAFYGCVSLGSVKIGHGVETLGISAFHSCSQLRYVTIPKSVKKIDMNAFKDVNNLTYVYYEGLPENFDAIEIDQTNYLIKDAQRFYECGYDGDKK